MTSTGPRLWGIGKAFRRTGVAERTLRCNEELGLRAPARYGGGRRRYDGGSFDRLDGVRLLRELGAPAADVTPDASDLRELSCRHRADLDVGSATASWRSAWHAG